MSCVGGTIDSIEIRFLSLSFDANPPTFTLAGHTTGGPPRGSWTRNGTTIHGNEASFSISLEYDTSNKNFAQEVSVLSILVVTGSFPGEYIYSAVNRAFSSHVFDSIFIDGK